jgi:hypothetical protein
MAVGRKMVQLAMRSVEGPVKASPGVLATAHACRQLKDRRQARMGNVVRIERRNEIALGWLCHARKEALASGQTTRGRAEQSRPRACFRLPLQGRLAAFFGAFPRKGGGGGRWPVYARVRLRPHG